MSGAAEGSLERSVGGQPDRDATAPMFGPRHPAPSDPSNPPYPPLPAPPEAPGPDDRFGNYRLLRRLDSGGMGEVWLALHLQLRCERAIKFPIERLASNRRWRADMLREARILETLRHPNIAVLYDFVEHGGRCGLVMEFVSGLTLADVLKGKGQLSLSQTRQIMGQIAAALHYAHNLERPVVHRDLKPRNVMVRPDDVVRVLDWGLALAVLDTDSSSGAELHPSASTGPILGTPGYMAPEQVRGKLADARADIWAFGCILFECLTGRFAFPRVADDISATLTDEPQWDQLPSRVPSALRRLLERCLRKDPRERPQSIAEVIEALERDDDSALRAATSDRAPTNLTPALTSFVGRARELARIRQLMLQPDLRLLTLTGFGGCGKTRLALRLAEESLASSPRAEQSGPLFFPGGVWLVELASITDASLIPQAIFAALPDTGKGDSTADPRAALVQRLATTQTLLVLDNCEHLAAACRDLVAELLRQCPRLRIIATSREPLGVEGEQHVDVQPMATPRPGDRLDLAAVAAVDAVDLFVRRVRLVQPDFELTADNVSAVAEICRRLDGIPFAIELAAARTRSMPLDQIAARLDNVFVLLKKAAPASTRSHATLEATIRWSYEMLDPSQRSLLDQLLVFQGGWTLEAAEAVCQVEDPQGRDVAELLSDLVEKSLVVFEQVNGWPRYRMLEAVRQFVSERSSVTVREGREPTDARHHLIQGRHADFFTRLADIGNRNLYGAEQSAWLERLCNDHENFRAVFDRSGDTSANLDDAVQLAILLNRYCVARGRFEDAQVWLTRAVARRGDRVDRIQMRAHNAMGILAWRRGDLGAAERAYRLGLDTARCVGDQRSAAAILNNLGMIAHMRRDRTASSEYFAQAASAYASLHDDDGLARTRLNIGAHAARDGHFDLARSMLEQALRHFESAGDELSIATLHHEFGELELRQRQFAEARRHLFLALRRRHKLRNEHALAETLCVLGLIDVELGDHQQAWELFGAAASLSQRAGIPLRHFQDSNCQVAFAECRRVLGLTDADDHQHPIANPKPGEVIDRMLQLAPGSSILFKEIDHER